MGKVRSISMNEQAVVYMKRLGLRDVVLDVIKFTS